MTREKAAQISFYVCIFGLVVSFASLLPSFNGPYAVPWPIFVGSAIYLPASFVYIFASRGKNLKLAVGKLRFIRLGFAAVMAILVWRILAPF